MASTLDTKLKGWITKLKVYSFLMSKRCKLMTDRYDGHNGFHFTKYDI